MFRPILKDCKTLGKPEYTFTHSEFENQPAFTSLRFTPHFETTHSLKALQPSPSDWRRPSLIRSIKQLMS